jgi:mannose-1-phosphate guanylyltransferase / phosphomannomutase
MKYYKSAILFADRKGEELTPLHELYSPALLPIAGKSPLEFWFEYLCEQKVEEVFVFVGSHSTAIKAQFSSGEHWGFTLHYLLSKGEELPQDLISRNLSELPSSYLAARADVVPQPRNDGSLANCFEHNEDQSTQEQSAHSTLDALSWDKMKNGPQAPQLLLTLQDFADITRQVLESKHWCCTPRGLMLDDHKWTATPEFSAERIDAIEDAIYVGRESIVDRSVSIKGGVSIEANCFIDRGANLNNAVVLPGTYIGQNVSVHNSLVAGSLLIDLTHGMAQQISDPALLSPIDMNAALMRTQNSERFAAAILMLLTAWIVLPVALLGRKRGKGVLDRKLHRSNRGSRNHAIELELLSFATPWSEINRWPQLIHVIDGDLKLFGTPIEPVDFSPERDLPLAQGVITPIDLHPAYAFDTVELQLWGLELANTKRGFLSNTLRGLKTMLAPKLGRTKSA